MSETETQLPSGFRIIEGLVVMGTGMGDERFGPILQRWEARSARRGLFLRRKTVTKWWTVEKGSGFEDNSAELAETAWELSKR